MTFVSVKDNTQVGFRRKNQTYLGVFVWSAESLCNNKV